MVGLPAADARLLRKLVEAETSDERFAAWTTAGAASRAALYNRGLVNRNGSPTDKAWASGEGSSNHG